MVKRFKVQPSSVALNELAILDPSQRVPETLIIQLCGILHPSLDGFLLCELLSLWPRISRLSVTLLVHSPHISVENADHDSLHAVPDQDAGKRGRSALPTTALVRD